MCLEYVVVHDAFPWLPLDHLTGKCKDECHKLLPKWLSGFSRSCPFLLTCSSLGYPVVGHLLRRGAFLTPPNPPAPNPSTCITLLGLTTPLWIQRGIKNAENHYFILVKVMSAHDRKYRWAKMKSNSLQLLPGAVPVLGSRLLCSNSFSVFSYDSSGS